MDLLRSGGGECGGGGVGRGCFTVKEVFVFGLIFHRVNCLFVCFDVALLHVEMELVSLSRCEFCSEVQ